MVKKLFDHVKTITNYYIYEDVCSCGCVEKVKTNTKLPLHGVSYGVNYDLLIQSELYTIR